MIEICCIIIFIFGLIACFITILQGLKVGREQYDNTLNKYQYWRNRTVKDHDIREGFPYEVYGLVPAKYWKRLLALKSSFNSRKRFQSTFQDVG